MTQAELPFVILLTAIIIGAAGGWGFLVWLSINAWRDYANTR